MWTKLSQRLTDPLFYRKRWLQFVRPLRPPCALRPVELDNLLGIPGPVLMIIAHPDDELFASGLLCELTACGKACHIACLTRGEGGITGGITREELGRQREAELRASAAALSVTSVEFLGHIDPLGKAHRTFAPDVSVHELAEQITSLLERHQPSLLITHGSGGEYWHPAHLLVRDAVLRAAKSSCDILTIHAWQEDHPLPSLLNRDDPADLVIDGSSHCERRLAAFRAHCSQHDYFAGHGGGSLEAFIDLSAREGYRYYPVI